ncbi:putative metal-dependent phosphoesterase TrpH [Breznakia sp. PF5-3]|uniref:PHP domain-containing protein n=1 Tax=unclassified Breznakia TaxID=2623764 RepID=UPI002405416A|nr:MULTISPECIES: PHP domain-containing protein [unclassified Breznakia]MDF9825065.1 putative metal-dependent phosphoesterase TrpH [Breznakia sp. PM6-1]MDF9835912.1 putative metal-dependent phosphoesterase TrpH [Breznakia sp. PF5-3]MDF9837373.1 putative metal-dependent phosphoesterase TrpH [Breznakia sp. PFB2-8]MDF9859308.1 putative metal-dependent phosphoesterase TrpH [Breznakia sp. PH5-24]
MNKIDLHMHSLYSDDGEYTPQMLIDMANKKAISYIAITDHNSTKAYFDNVDKKGIEIIPAIELDVTFQDKDFHLLGYGIDPTSDIFEEIEETILEQELAASQMRLDVIQNILNVYIDKVKLDALSPNGVYVAETICEVIMEDERNRDNPYLKEYYPGGARSDNPYVNFYWDYCAKGKPAYVEIKYITLEDALTIYRKQGALVVLAHPGNNVKENDQLMEDIIDSGIDGIEVYSSYHSAEQIDYYKNYAQSHQLLMTCGSDFHGKTKPRVFMGECRMPKAEEDILINEIRKLMKQST